MTPQELLGRTEQAISTARHALEKSKSAPRCTPEAHDAVVDAMACQLDISEAQAKFFGNGFLSSVEDAAGRGVARAMEDSRKKYLDINGFQLRIPSIQTMWNIVVLVGVVVGILVGKSPAQIVSKYNVSNDDIKIMKKLVHDLSAQQEDVDATDK